jgi:hypothetical protein
MGSEPGRSVANGCDKIRNGTRGKTVLTEASGEVKPKLGDFQARSDTHKRDTRAIRLNETVVGGGVLGLVVRTWS